MGFGALNVESQCSWAVVQSYTAVADMPVVATTAHGVQTQRKLWKYRKCSTLTGWSMFPLQFIDKVWASP